MNHYTEVEMRERAEARNAETEAPNEAASSEKVTDLMPEKVKK